MSDEIVPQKLDDLVAELNELGMSFVLTAQIDDQIYYTTAKATASSGDLIHLLLALCQTYAEAAEDEQSNAKQSKLALH